MTRNPVSRAFCGIFTVIGRLITLGFYLALGFIVLALLTTHSIKKELKANPDYVEEETDCDKYRFCSKSLGIPKK